MLVRCRGPDADCGPFRVGCGLREVSGLWFEDGLRREGFAGGCEGEAVVLADGERESLRGGLVGVSGRRGLGVEEKAAVGSNVGVATVSSDEDRRRFDEMGFGSCETLESFRSPSALGRSGTGLWSSASGREQSEWGRS